MWKEVLSRSTENGGSDSRYQNYAAVHDLQISTLLGPSAMGVVLASVLKRSFPLLLVLQPAGLVANCSSFAEVSERPNDSAAVSHSTIESRRQYPAREHVPDVSSTYDCASVVDMALVVESSVVVDCWVVT